jgi:hypothetical protein
VNGSPRDLEKMPNAAIDFSNFSGSDVSGSRVAKLDSILVSEGRDSFFESMRNDWVSDIFRSGETLQGGDWGITVSPF